MTTEEEHTTPNRRRKLRFPIQCDLRYRLLEEGAVIATGVGQTTNMASGGMAFTTERELSPGDLVELAISWPVLLNETCPVRLIVFGRVVRGSGGTSACIVDKYEFRTQSRAVQPAPVTRADSTLRRWAAARAHA